MTTYIVTRQNTDGTFDEVGSNNRTVITGYKSYQSAMRYAIKPFAQGRVVRVEVYHNDNVHRTPDETFHTDT
jgi:hypothetical protein